MSLNSSESQPLYAEFTSCTTTTIQVDIPRELNGVETRLEAYNRHLDSTPKQWASGIKTPLKQNSKAKEKSARPADNERVI
ncbi:hypothetical protein HNR48_003957 [Pseudoteredinibacter isoporae]|uniref:Uncharacterized protein n=1 Tax=Pseudoteredinibacter isoporae TaxID=570281 RepID=A0A7X0JXS2_9GAMM|nr:hypothetical protein [Pseudoteredinibacter isoporae]